jgi:hypothetical protein
VNKPNPTTILSFTDLIGPLGVASFGGYAIGVTIVFLVWQMS